ncbi:DUF1285 domain-containing protein [bacterium]|nr:DUF1285 domain-containing protein [bacterium]
MSAGGGPLIDVSEHPLAGNFHILSDGTWQHDGEEITHERTWRYLSRHLSTDDDGRVFLTDGKIRVDVVVDDAPLLVTALRPAGDHLRLRLHDDTHDVLDPSTLRMRAGKPYCEIRFGLTARFSNAAWMQLTEYVREEKGRWVLAVGASRNVLPLDGF